MNGNSQTIEIKANMVGFDELREKANQLKSLLQEVKELAASLDVQITIDGKPVSKSSSQPIE